MGVERELLNKLSTPLRKLRKSPAYKFSLVDTVMKTTGKGRVRRTPFKTTVSWQLAAPYTRRYSPDVPLEAFLALNTLTTKTAGKLEVLGHDCDALRMDGKLVRVLKQAHQVALSGLLER